MISDHPIRNRSSHHILDILMQNAKLENWDVNFNTAMSTWKGNTGIISSFTYNMTRVLHLDFFISSKSSIAKTYIYDLVQNGVQMGVGFLTVNKIHFKHFVLWLLCVCVHNWSVSQWKQSELQIWNSWGNIIFWKWKVPRVSTPENRHAHGEYFQCFHSRTWWIKTLPQSPICTEEISLYTVHIKSIITKFCFWS